MPARPFPPLTRSRSARLRSSVAALSLGSSRKSPVVLSRKMASYCLRFSGVIAAASYVMVVIQAPVLSPRYSTIFAASGIEVCTQPTARPRTKHTAQALGRCVGLIWQGGHHGRDVGRVGKLLLRTAAGEASAKSLRWAICGFRRNRCPLCETHGFAEYCSG